MGAKGQKERTPVVAAQVDYRRLDSLNYSSIVTFEKSPVKFYEQFMLGIPREDEDTAATLIGNVVDDVILTYQGDLGEFEQEFGDRYALYSGEPSAAQGFMLADELFRITLRSIVDGEVTVSFEERFREAFELVQAEGKYKNKTVEQGLEDFRKPNRAGGVPETYFQAKLDNIGKMVISAGLKARALQISSYALVDPFTKDLFDFSNSDTNKVEKLSKFPITFMYEGESGKIEGKCEVDMLEINHIDYTIQPFDLKTTYDNTLFDINYLKNRYYIQTGWYTLGIQAWAKENGFEDYEVLPFKFIVLDTSKNDRRPVIRTLNTKHIVQAWDGFDAYGRQYKGVIQLVEDILWANTNGIWNCSRAVYENNGVLPLEDYA